mmetsp:Transcript_66078/g.207053  ORF Transcript_66078/g.207053 Transcript_66078/m.207053 type:complete len:202 (-) Transcript_66078:170-775(-)
MLLDGQPPAPDPVAREHRADAALQADGGLQELIHVLQMLSLGRAHVDEDLHPEAPARQEGPPHGLDPHGGHLHLPIHVSHPFGQLQKEDYAPREDGAPPDLQPRGRTRAVLRGVLQGVHVVLQHLQTVLQLFRQDGRDASHLVGQAVADFLHEPSALQPAPDRRLQAPRHLPPPRAHNCPDLLECLCPLLHLTSRSLQGQS